MSSTAQRPAGQDRLAIDLATSLGQAHNFSPAALAANRTGRLAPEQAAALRGRALRSLVPGLAILGGALLLAVAVGAAEGARIFVQMLLFSGIVALAGGRLIVIGLRYFRDARAGLVVALEGAVTRSRSLGADAAGNNKVIYHYHVGGDTFRVSAAAYAALPAGQACRLYYSPAGRELLSIEPLASPDAQPAPAPRPQGVRERGAGHPAISVAQQPNI